MAATLPCDSGGRNDHWSTVDHDAFRVCDINPSSSGLALIRLVETLLDVVDDLAGNLLALLLLLLVLALLIVGSARRRIIRTGDRRTDQGRSNAKRKRCCFQGCQVLAHSTSLSVRGRVGGSDPRRPRAPYELWHEHNVGVSRPTPSRKPDHQVFADATNNLPAKS